MIPFDCEFWTSIETTSSSMQWWPERKISQIVVPWQHPWKSNTKQRMVFRMIHVKDSLLPRGKVWSLDFLGFPKFKKALLIVSHILLAYCGRWSTSFDPKNLSGMFYFIWVVVSNIFNFHPDPWGNDNLTSIFFRWVGSTTNQSSFHQPGRLLLLGPPFWGWCRCWGDFCWTREWGWLFLGRGWGSH